MSVMKETLSKLGLSEESQKIYSESLGLGALTIAEITMITGIDYETVSRSIEELKKFELVKEIRGAPPRYEMLPPYKLFVSQFTQFGNLLTEFSGKIRVSVVESIKDMERETQKFEEQVKGELSKTIETVTREIEEKLTEIIESLKTTTKQTLQNQTDALVNNVTNVIKSNTETLRKVFERALSEIVEKEIENMVNRFNDGKSVLEELYQETIKHEAPALEPLWVIRGLNGILAHIKDMMSRANAFVLIITPNPDYIPIDKIMGLPKLVRVQVASKFDLGNSEHAEIVKKLLSRERTFVRNYQKGIVLGAIVDDKEAIFTTTPEVIDSPERIMGVATTSYEWVMASHDFLTYAWTTSEDVKL
ncbi:MAG: helix-turn-helix domain-containing protein [Candidatus Njordarchaeia archaeon]